MPMNNLPVLGNAPINGWDGTGPLTTANTAKDGTGTVQTLVTAGADGAFIEKVVAKPRGTNTASVLRIFINNGGANSVAANNKFLAELSLPATTLSEVAAQADVEKVLNLRLQANYKLICCIGTTVAAGWDAMALGASYTA